MREAWVDRSARLSRCGDTMGVHGEWRSLAARGVWDAEVASSNLASPTGAERTAHPAEIPYLASSVAYECGLAKRRAVNLP